MISGYEFKHQSSQLEELFSVCFQKSYQTLLVGGASEPEYLPRTEEAGFHQLLYREDFFASALHEVAHWCIAGEKRRMQRDFGYWYEAEGRGEASQRAFELVEVKPQAMECLFSEAAGFAFSASVDNLALNNRPSKAFSRALCQQISAYLDTGLPSRASVFLERIHKRYQIFKTAGEFREHMSSVLNRLSNKK